MIILQNKLNNIWENAYEKKIFKNNINSANCFINILTNGSTDPEGSKPIIQIISAVLGVVRTAGAAVAIIILMTIAAKYIMASAGDRADIKKYAVNYVIGAIILFGTTGILGVVKSFVDTSIK